MTIKKLLEAGLRAPSNNHLREWEFIVVQDQATRLNLIDKVQKRFTKEEVAAWFDSWGSTDPIQRECYHSAVPKQYSMLLEAACLILPCFRQPQPLLKPDSLSALNPFASIWCCIENILVAAVAEGIYGVTRIPMGAEIEHIKKVINCPSDYEIPCYLALGYPSENAIKIEPYPINVDEKIHWNSWPVQDVSPTHRATDGLNYAFYWHFAKRGLWFNLLPGRVRALPYASNTTGILNLSHLLCGAGRIIGFPQAPYGRKFRPITQG